MHFEVPALYESKMGLTWVPIPLAPLVNKTFFTRGIVRKIWECERHGNERDMGMKGTWERERCGNGRDVRMRGTWESKIHRNERDMRMGDTWCDLFKMRNVSFKYSITVEQTGKIEVYVW